MSKNIELKFSPAKLSIVARKYSRYSLVGFIAVVVIAYGFVLFRISSLGQLEPTDEAITSQVKADQVPHIDEAVVKQLESLEDNSVSVQTLFDEARSNPFQ